MRQTEGEQGMDGTVVVAGDTSPAGRAALREAGVLARERDGTVHVVAPRELHGDRAARELTGLGVVVHLHLADGPLERAVAAVARAGDGLVVTTAASATRVMQGRPPRGVRVVGDDLGAWSPPPAGGLERATLALYGVGGATVVTALDTALLGSV